MEEQKIHKSSALRDLWKTLFISSPAFTDQGPIPKKYSCQGEDIMPPLSIEGIPKEARSLVLIIDDPDAPGKTWVHYVSWNIPPTSHISEGASVGTEGLNDFNQHSYGGPCPPSGKHRYHFKVYALNNLLEIPAVSTKHDVELAMNNHILAYGELLGTYSKG